jgi:hypothetical protein
MPILGIWASSFRSAAGPVGAYDALATVTVPSGGAASVSFVGIPSGYKHLQLRSISSVASGTPYVLAVFNGDSSSANYVGHYIQGNGSAVQAGSDVNSLSGWGYNNQSTNVGSQVTDFLDYSNTNKFKTFRTLNGYDANGSGLITFSSGLWKSTTAITSIVMTPSSSSFAQHSTFALYGVK